jgi:hypothetical protein
MTPETRRDLKRLLSALCDGELTVGELARLEAILQADAECRRFYLEYLDMHARLLVHPLLSAGTPRPPGDTGHAACPPEETRTPAADRPPTAHSVRRKLPRALRYVAVAAGAVAATLFVQALWWQPPPPADREPAHGPAGSAAHPSSYVATLAQTADCVWEDPGPRRVGSRLPPGELRLRSGAARLRFDSGAELLVEGPAALRLDSPAAATLLRGKVVFRGDETAAPFDLRTPSSTLIDVGTEYAVAVAADGEEIHVFDGSVQRTARADGGAARTEYLKAGEARRYAGAAEPGRPAAADPARFVRSLPAPKFVPPGAAAGLLAYEGFDYADPEAFRDGKAEGGLGWEGPWVHFFARPLHPEDEGRLVLNPRAGLKRPAAPGRQAAGSFDYTGFTKYYRRLASPVRLDTEAVYYLSFLFRRDGPSDDDDVNAVAVLLWTEEEYQLVRRGADDPRKRLNVGVRGRNQLFTQLRDASCRIAMPLRYGETYLLVAKVVASASHPDQVFLRVYGRDEPVERDEPGSWSVVGPPLHSDLVFDWLQVHVNSRRRQTLDELRLGTTWASVTAPWAAPAPQKDGRP